jgi:hypothetical protein
MSICGDNFSFFSASSQSYEFFFNPNNIYFIVSRPNFLSVNLNNDQDMSSIDANKCFLKPDANAT